MERWKGRVAVVTGAATGIGAGIVQKLLQHGMVVVGVDPRDQLVKALETPGSPGKLHAQKGDITKEEDILKVFAWVKQNLGKVDVLVNNAGVFTDSPLTDFKTEDFRRMLDVNVMGLTLCTREAVKLMREKGVNDAHVIHIGSVAGLWLPSTSERAFYHATKSAVRVLAEGLRKDFLHHDDNMRVTVIHPGLVNTDIVLGMKSLTKEQLLKMPHLMPEDIADAVVYVLGAPPTVLVHEMMVMPVKESGFVDNNK